MFATRRENDVDAGLESAWSCVRGRKTPLIIPQARNACLSVRASAESGTTVVTSPPIKHPFLFVLFALTVVVQFAADVSAEHFSSLEHFQQM